MTNTSKGKIIKGVGGLYTVRITESDTLEVGSLVKCRARGSFRHDGFTPLAGDKVTLLWEDSLEKDCVIDSVDPRKNSLIRPPMANLDLIFITMAAASPTPILTTVDKLIAICEHNKIEPIIVITKEELSPDYADELKEIYEKCGFMCFSLSAKENIGIEAIDRFIEENMRGKTAAFAGASGIGKSTLMNALFPSLRLSTSEISRKIERGRHTTREVELFPLSEEAECGYIADTPGFSMLDFARFDFFDKDDLPTTFREFLPLIGECRYKKCTHTKEEGCAILSAVKAKKIPPSRHESYIELYDVLKAKKKWN